MEHKQEVAPDGAQNDEDADGEPIDPRVEAIKQAYARMLKDIRLWGQMLLLFAVLNLVGASVFNAPYGVMLLIVALASFYFRQASMYIVYAVTLAWAAVSNLLSSSGLWMGFGLIQLYMAWSVFRAYQHYGSIETAYRDLAGQGVIEDPPTPQHAAGIFPTAGCLISALALLGVVALILVIFSAIILETSVPEFVNFGAGLVVNVAVLGLAAGLAALAARYQSRVLAALGVAASLLVLIMWLAFLAFLRLNA
jgi:hypothetical protein